MGFRGICARRNVFNFTGERFLSAMHTLCVQAISYSSLKSICNWGEGLGWPCCCCCFENIDCETQTLPSCVRISDSSRLIRGISRFTRKLTFMTSHRLRLWEKRSIFDSRSRGRQKFAILIELPIVRASAFTRNFYAIVFNPQTLGETSLYRCLC